MILVDSVYKSFNGSPVVRGVSLQINNAQLLGICGPSGAGKSVLLKMIGGIIKPDKGSVNLEGEDPESADTGFLFQEGALFDSMTVLDNVAFPLRARQLYGRLGQRSTNKLVSRTEAYERAYEVLGAVGLGDAYKKLPGQLSGGMRRRVALARALVTRPALALLDDPTGGLDPVTSNRILDLIESLRTELNSAIILVSQDIRRLLPRVDRVVCLFSGKVLFDGPPVDLPKAAPREVLSFLAKRFELSELESLEERPDRRQ